MRRRLGKKLTIVLIMAVVVGTTIGPVLAQQQAKININTATAEELSALKRVGPSYAQRIVDYREQHGPFQQPEDIMKVQGIGIKTFEVNKDIITCE